VIGYELFVRFGVALSIGILIGLQREYAYDEPDHKLFAGVRTFALMGLLGCTAAMISQEMASPWPFLGMLIVVGALMAISYFEDAARGKLGLTTEMSALLTILSGALAYYDQIVLAVALGVAVTALLSIKIETRRFVELLTREDIIATLKFAIISVIVLPILPNRAFGFPPFDIFNPYKIWLLVVLISGISFVGYILIKWVGPERGIGLTGLLGGLASSTALTLTFTQRSRTSPDLSRPFGFAIIVAWTVMFSRVFVEVAAVNPDLIRIIWAPITASVAVGLIYAAYRLLLESNQEKDREITFSNPFNLLPAIKFGLLFVLILLVSRAGQVYFGNAGIYISSLISGLADVDAIVISVADLSLTASGPSPLVASRAILIAAIANTFAKGMLVFVSGTSELRKAILPGFILMIATTAGITFLALR
jgi:uncharacterized membrane protein (DUF4010 family)